MIFIIIHIVRENERINDILRNYNVSLDDVKVCNMHITNFNDLKNNILKYHGISFKYILSTIFEEKNYYSPVLSNSEKSNEILKYKNDSIESYYMRLKRRSRKSCTTNFICLQRLWI